MHRAAFNSRPVDTAWMFFVVAPKMDASGIKGQGKITRVDLSLE